MYGDDVSNSVSFPDRAGDSITDRGIFLTCLALLASMNIISDREQGYISLCHVFGFDERRKTG